MRTAYNGYWTSIPARLICALINLAHPLRQADDEGDPIYTVYRPAGISQSAVCAAVRAAGSGAYGKWLDYTTEPAFMIPC